jgi:hypothetical protein
MKFDELNSEPRRRKSVMVTAAYMGGLYGEHHRER